MKYSILQVLITDPAMLYALEEVELKESLIQFINTALVLWLRMRYPRIFNNYLMLTEQIRDAQIIAKGKLN